MTYSIISKHRSKLMGVAALWIYIFHVLPAPAYQAAQGLEKVWWYVRNAGFCGVDMFLFVSGLGLAYSLKRQPVSDGKSYLRFLGRRFLKIYITYLPFAIIYALLDGWALDLLLKRLVCLDQFTGNLYNFCWYVCCILLMYLLTPLLHGLVEKRPWGTVLLGVCYGAALLAGKGVVRSDLYAIAVRLPVFVLGLWTAKYAREDRKITGLGGLVGGVMLLSGLVLSYGLNGFLIPSPMPSGNALVNVLLAPGLIMALSALFELLEGRRWFAPAAKVLSFFGGISFEFYLLQEWYVRRGIHVLRAQGAAGQWIVFGVMLALSVALQKLSGLGKIVFRKN